MGPPSAVLLPLLAAGFLGVLMFGADGNAGPQPRPPSVPPAPVPGLPKLRMMMGTSVNPYFLPVVIDPRQIVVLYCEYEEGELPGTRTQLWKQNGFSAHGELIWLEDLPSVVISTLGVPPGQFIKVHQPLGRTEPRPGPEWDDEESMEVVPMWINRSQIEAIGPSPVLHTKRRRLGKVYTKDGDDFELYESLEALRQIVGSDVPEIEGSYRPRYD